MILIIYVRCYDLAVFLRKAMTKYYEYMKDKKIIITGGTGFLGTNLALSLLHQGATLMLLDNFSRRGVEKNYALIKQKYPDIQSRVVEITDIPHIIHIEKPDLIYHFAAQVAVTSSILSPIDDFRINAEGSFLIARAAAEYDIPIIYASTNKVYGDNVNKIPIREYAMRYDFASSLKGNGISEDFSIDAAKQTPYGCSKLVGEIYVREWGGVANRFSCMYGPNQYGIVDQGWVSYFIARKLSGEGITIYGDGKQVRDLLYVDDVVRLLELQGKRFFDSSKPSIAGEVFSIGGGYANTLSVLELCRLLEIKPVFGPWRPSDQKVFYCDIKKAKRALGWEPMIGVDKGLASLIEWQKEFHHVE